MAGLGAVGAGWGAFIGTDIRERRKAADLPADLPDSTHPRSQWFDPLVTVAISAGLIGIGLAIAIIGETITGWRSSLVGPTVTAIALISVAGVVVFALAARTRSHR